MSVIKVPAFHLKAGQRPVTDRAGPAGIVCLREWQESGYAALREHRQRILLAPTGSGKSTLIKALAATELAEDPTRRVIIAVPQLVIARSLGPASISAGDRSWRWDPEHMLVYGGPVCGRDLARFVKGKPGKTAGSRALVCSHMTLVRAFQKLDAAEWSNISVYLDEAHHSHAEDEEDFRNELGSLVVHWLDANPGPITLVTATWLRASLLDIVPRGRLAEFTKFTHSMEDYLASMKHMRDVSFRFLLGKPEEALRAIYAEGDRKTIAWLPNIASAHLKAHGDKYQALANYQAAIGEVTSRAGWTSTIRHKPDTGRPYSVCTLDFVTEEGRPERKAALEAALDSGGPTPSLLWSLNLGKEGFDWPELERAIVIGERGSIPDVIQMMGRVLRDHPGKSTAEFNMILPYEGEADPSLLRDYIKTILVSMVVEWHVTYALPRLPRTGKKEETDLTLGPLDDPQTAAKIVSDVAHSVVMDPDAIDEPEATIAGAVEREGIDAETDEGKSVIAEVRRMFSDRTRAMCANASDLNVDIDLSEDVFGCVRLLVARFGYETLGDFRKALNNGRAVASAEEARARVRGLMQKDYDAARKTWPDGSRFPDSSHFPKHYGMPFAAFRDGRGSADERAAMLARIQKVAARNGASEEWVAKVLATAMGDVTAKELH